MDKCKNNICKHVLIAGQQTCAGEVLLNEYIEWCKKLNIRCVTRGKDPNPTKSRTDKFNLKKALWADNDKEIRAALNRMEKVMEKEMPTTKIERNDLQDLTLAVARSLFRYRCQIIENIKGNRSSQWRNNMECKHCTTGDNETQDHLEKCTFFSKHRDGLDLTTRMHKLILWRSITQTLKVGID